MTVPWTLCTAMRAEEAALHRGLRGLPVRERGTLLRTGVGPVRARRLAGRVGLTSGPAFAGAAVAVAGIGGGLSPRLRPGDVVVGDQLLFDPAAAARSTGDAAGESARPLPGAELLANALRQRGLTVYVGPIVSTDRLVDGLARKRLAGTGALVADLESAWLLAGAAGRPLACVRVVADSPPGRLYRPATLGQLRRALRVLPLVAAGLAEWAGATSVRRVVLASPRSFCAGVDRAIEVVRRALEQHGPPVYVRKQIVHNSHVVAELRARGAVFVDDLTEVPPGAVTVFSAHGVSPAVRVSAAQRQLSVIDATCPLVTKVHAEARRYAGRGDTVLLIGHDGHEETEGTLGEAPDRTRLVPDLGTAEKIEVDDPQQVSYLVQTTLAVDEAATIVAALRRRFPALAGPPSDDICYATTNRQQAVAEVAAGCDVVLVLGSENSSNSLRLVEVARRAGAAAYLVEDAGQVDLRWLTGARTVGVTAGASAPPALVDQVVDALRGLGAVDVAEHASTVEDVHFTLPKEVRAP